MSALAARLRPCGPVVDEGAARRAHERLSTAGLEAESWALIEHAWPALEPVFGASPYLAGLAVRDPQGLVETLRAEPDRRLAEIIAPLGPVTTADGDGVGRMLRRQKSRLHLLCAVADLGGVWSLGEVMAALSGFADAAVRCAMSVIAREAAHSGWTAPAAGEEDILRGAFVIAMGKLGGDELNYSSDIDLSVFYDPAALPLTGAVEPARLAQRLVDRLTQLLQARTAEGYVFRLDFRLRPDPLSTPPAASVPSALLYYQSVGQNWERAAFIKARPLAGDMAAAAAFLDELRPFVWRRNLDFAAIADIQSIKQQIHTFKVDDRLSARGADLKLGRGGIREVEFYVQTLQLIHGGRDASLRSARTLEALAALVTAGRVSPEAAADLASGYETLRGLEHRLQMIADDQTHRLPEANEARRRVAALAGAASLPAFDAAVGRVLRRVNRRYGELFAKAEPLSSTQGSLVFTGVEDDPETLRTLERLGFAQAERVSHTIRAWHHGHVRATRSARERELLTRLTPRLLEAMAATGAADTAFLRFSDFFERLSSSTQLQSLFLAQPRLLTLVVRVMAFAPRFARTLAQRPAVLDALLDPRFFAEVGARGDDLAIDLALAQSPGFEAAMDEARRLYAESAFRIGAQVLSGRASAAAAGAAFAELADGLIAAMAERARSEVTRTAGDMDAQVAVVALGSCGGREMTVRSDLDLMTLYSADPGGESALKGWSADTFHARFTQRLLAALSALTPAGGLYKVDLQLRPSGSAGPVAVSLPAFERYHEAEAETWEAMALTRARVVWASSPDFAVRVTRSVERALRWPRDASGAARDAREMRQLMSLERPAWGVWDLKLARGGLVDIEFCAQHLQIIGAAAGGPLRQNTGEALAALAPAHPALAPPLTDLGRAWRLQSALAQVLKIALDDAVDPAAEPAGLKALLARMGGARSFAELERRLASARARVLAAFDRVFGG